jgi:hypothetical protein
MDLQEALERTGKAYAKERLHPAPTDVMAQNIGYRGANNGSALSALASLRYYGLMERPREGVLAVAKDYENYLFAPNEAAKRALLQKFFQTPPLFRELLEQYEDGFPSEATLKYELIQRGFLPQAAATLVTVVKRSAEFAETQLAPSATTVPSDSSNEAVNDVVTPSVQSQPAPPTVQSGSAGAPVSPPAIEGEAGHDRIPVRLSGNRRAWLIIPEPFFEADKKRLKAQIDLLLTEDDEVEHDL